MKCIPMPLNEEARIRALHEMNILDSARETNYDDIVKLAAHLCDAPMAFISLVDTNRQWFKAIHGVDATETPRDIAFCAYALESPEPLIVEDAMLDARFRNNPLVLGSPFIRFYAGFPLITSDGLTLGTLCVGGSKPRKLNPEQIACMKALAKSAISQIELRRSLSKQSQQAERYEQLVNNLKEVVFQTDTEGRWKFLNPAWIEMTQYSVEESLGRSVIDFVHTEDQFKNIEKFRPLVLGKKDYSRDQVRYIRKNGEERWVEVYARPTFDSTGNVLGISGTLTDITEGKLFSEKIEQRERVLKSFFDSCPFMMGTIELTPTDIIHHSLNKQTTDFLKLPEPIQFPLSARQIGMPDENLAVWRHHYEQARLEQRPVRFEYSHVDEKGGKRTLAGFVNLIPQTHGENLFSFIAQDVSDERKQKEVFEDQQMKMIQSARLSSLGEMAAGIGHEINNPLTIIRATVQIMEHQISTWDVTPEVMKFHIQKIDKTVERIAKIVSGLRAFAREGDQDTPVVSSANSILNETLDLCQSRMHSNGIELIVDVPDHSLMLNCRAIQISQVLINLLNNSFDAVADMQEKWVKLDLQETSSEVVFRVTDSGPGIPRALREKIMQPFFTTKDPGKGTGLGLSLSNGIVVHHGGRLELDLHSERTCFIVTLPKFVQAA